MDYMIQIESTNKIIQKYFNFSSDDVKCQYSLIQLQILVTLLMKENIKKNK